MTQSADISLTFAPASHSVITYGASPELIDPSQLPFASYKDPIVRAARDNQLPEDYVSELERLPVAEQSG